MVHSKTKQPSHRSSAPALGHPETAWNKHGYSLQVNYQHRGFYSAVPCPRVVNEPTKAPNTRNSQAIDSPPLAQSPNVDFGKNYSIAVESIQEFIKVQRKKRSSLTWDWERNVTLSLIFTGVCAPHDGKVWISSFLAEVSLILHNTSPLDVLL